MTYDDIKNTIPYERPFYVKSFDGAGISSGILLALENDKSLKWQNAITNALSRFGENDYGDMYGVGEKPVLGKEWGYYESPFGDKPNEGAIMVHSETSIDPWGKLYGVVILFLFEM